MVGLSLDMEADTGAAGILAEIPEKIDKSSLVSEPDLDRVEPDTVLVTGSTINFEVDISAASAQE